MHNYKQMKHIKLLLTFYILFSFKSFSQDKDSTVNHGHFLGGVYGNVYIEASFKDQLLNGPFIIRDNKRKVLLKGSFNNNQKIGTWEKYHSKDTSYFLRKKTEYIVNKPAAIILETDSSSRKIKNKNYVLEYLPDTIKKFDSLIEYVSIQKQIIPSRNGGAFNVSEYGNLLSRFYRGITKNLVTIYADAELKNKILKPVFSESNKAVSIRTSDNFYFFNDFGLYQRINSIGIELKDGTIYWVSLNDIELKGINLVIDYSIFNALKQNLLPNRMLFENNVSKIKINRNNIWEIRSKQILMEIYSRELFY